VKQALIFLKEINRKKEAIKKTKSKYLINDYMKSIVQDESDLKEYCLYKGIDYKELKI
jgi:hypothetical protein